VIGGGRASAPEEALRSAIEYAERGLQVFPVHWPIVREDRVSCSCRARDCKDVGKHPLTRHGLKDATTDRRRIETWWGQWPMANVAIRTGAVSGLLVLDVDPRHGGAETLQSQIQSHGPIPETPRALTGGGGEHFYFSHPGGQVKSKNSAMPGLDVKADGGYVIAAPSRHKSGKSYQWQNFGSPNESPLAPPPAWVLRLVSHGIPNHPGALASGQRTRAGHGRLLLPAIIESGSRNDTLTRVAGKARSFGADTEEILAFLMAVNSRRCRPPLDAREIEAIARSVGRYAPPVSPPAVRLPSGLLVRPVGRSDR